MDTHYTTYFWCTFSANMGGVGVVRFVFWKGRFYFGLANSRRIAHTFHKLSQQIFRPCCSRLQPPPPKIHAQNGRHSSPISDFGTPKCFTPIFCLRGRSFLSIGKMHYIRFATQSATFEASLGPQTDFAFPKLFNLPQKYFHSVLFSPPSGCP